jgi:hypothetical protein
VILRILFGGNSLNAEAKKHQKSRVLIILTTKSTTMPKATRRTSRRQVEELARRLREMPKYKTKLYLEKEARRQEALVQEGAGSVRLKL